MNLPRLAVTSCRRRMPRAVPPSGDLWDQMTRTGLEISLQKPEAMQARMASV